MGKTGPCRHCGVTSTPLWRNGPPDKPILCNACGSRWRTKGSFSNYIPLNAREKFDSELKVSKSKNIPLKKQQTSHKKKQISIALESEHKLQCSDLSVRKAIERDVGNQSSSGSAISYSESCAHFGTTDAIDNTASAQSNVRDPLAPSKKRTFLIRDKPSPVEKLTKDLYSVLHEHTSNLSGSSEGELIYESGTPIGSETGYGSVLIRHPNSKSIEEESEASSLSFHSKPHTMSEASSASTYLPVHSVSKETTATSVGTYKIKKPRARENSKRDKLSDEILKMLLDSNSPLNSVDLNDVINFGVFLEFFTHGDQQQLMKYLPSLDTCKPPESLETMFTSTRFYETLSNIQQILQEGFSYISFSQEIGDQCRLMKRNMLHSLKVSEWAEPYEKIKGIKGGDGSVTKLNLFGAPNSTSLKRPNIFQNKSRTETTIITKSPKRAYKFDAPIAPSRCSSPGTNSTDEKDDLVDNEGTCFGPRSLSASSGSMLNPSQLTVDSSDHVALLDVPSNASLAEAVLLCNPSKDKTVQNGSQKGVVIKR